MLIVEGYYDRAFGTRHLTLPTSSSTGSYTYSSFSDRPQRWKDIIALISSLDNHALWTGLDLCKMNIMYIYWEQIYNYYPCTCIFEEIESVFG